MQDLGNQLFRFRESKDLKYICVDVESESLNLGGSNRPWQVSFIVVENGVIVKEFDKFPSIHDLKVGEGAAKVTRFNYDTYKSKSEPAIDVYNCLAEYLFNPQYYIVGQNLLNFDVYLIASLQKYLGKKVDYSYVPRIYDTKSLALALQLNISFPKIKEEIPAWMIKMCNFRQKGVKANNKFLAKMFDIEYDDEKSHDGLWDCQLSDKIFRQLYRRLEIW